MSVTPAHDQVESHKYTVHYPDHYPRESDPHYKLFEAYKKKYKATAKCYVGERVGFEHCQGGLELHHDHIEFAVQNEVSLQAVMKDYPTIDTEEELATWVESAPNFRWLCVKHHRGQSGAHTVAHSDFEAGLYAPGFLQ